MSFVQHPVTVQAPATSANLGPGFDALGLALTLHDTVTAEVEGDGLSIEVRGEGADEVPRDASHLLYRAMSAAFDLLGETPAGLRLTCENVIPHGRGLGSSAAAISAGIVLARALVDGGDDRLDDRAVLQLATDLEGHPDNVAAALSGGLAIAWIDGAAAEAVRLDVDADVTVFVPPQAVATETARGLLPAEVAHADAAFNAGRAALLIAALRDEPARLISATEDRLHQSFRAEAMPASYKLLRQLRVEGVPAVISGAGPSVLAFAHGITDAAPSGWSVHELGVAKLGTRIVA
ncbi:homoserine kinase [Aeromicrobium phragmitis]|uniref:Homoserine kinase n=1 Tax=Aeromicrobium phragmitis TaxID=2478914 RepID=A0A3L8PQ26_9ACTN|nr:homoserine kinase [Aeromicrobium phragmitis]RLV56813.1 homoserine kinase [Aeromicrobium phragmitis]